MLPQMIQSKQPRWFSRSLRWFGSTRNIQCQTPGNSYQYPV